MVCEPKTEFLLNVKSDIIDYVIDKVQETLETMVEYTIYQYSRKFGDINEHEKKWIRLHIEKELVSAFEVWTKPTDMLLDFYIAGSVNSLITFACVIRRDGESHMFNTTVVWTSLRYRNNYFNYLTKTSLPHTKRKELSKSYNQRILQLLQRKNLENKIYFTELNMNRVRCNILVSECKSDEDIIKSQKPEWHKLQSLCWEEAAELGYHVYYQDNVEFTFAKEYMKTIAVENFKEIRINRPKEKVRKLQEELKELKEKFDKLNLNEN